MPPKASVLKTVLAQSMPSQFRFPRFARPNRGRKTEGKSMKLLFYSSDRSEVEFLRQCLLEVCIDCEIHDNGAVQGLSLKPPEAELWIENDEDSYRAILLCVEHNIGFAKRAPGREDLAA
jgi:hypothetical protein